MQELEHWSVDAGERAVARLDIPPHASRERRFDIDVRFVVRAGAADEPWHALRVLVNGAQEWSRRVGTDKGVEDSLELHLRRSVPVGESLRLQALTDVGQAQRRRLTIVAQEA